MVRRILFSCWVGSLFLLTIAGCSTYADQCVGPKPGTKFIVGHADYPFAPAVPRIWLLEGYESNRPTLTEVDFMFVPELPDLSSTGEVTQ